MNETRTVKFMIEELSKFPPDAECYAYEGEVVALIVVKDGEQGVIYCSETGKQKETEYFTKGINNV